MIDTASDPERAIREACGAGEIERAATLALEVYSDEILSFLVARMRSTSDAQEVFSAFAEDLWLGQPAFAWRCSMRTWAYTLARDAAARWMTAPQRRGARNLPLSAMSQQRESARLRKAFERIKRELKELAAREGLLDPDA